MIIGLDGDEFGVLCVDGELWVEVDELDVFGECY